MGIYGDHILPRLLDWMMNVEELRRIRERCLEAATGEVLEVGFGSGLNLPHYPTTVEKLYAIDPAVLGRKLGSKRIEASSFHVQFVGLDGQSIPLPDASVDTAVTTWTLCTIPDPTAALSEMSRVLRPGGALLFVEHGRAPEPRVQRWQDRWNPIHKTYAGGCNLNRPMDAVLREGGFEISRLENFYIAGPKILTYHYLGAASPL